eukprot:366212-Chlamydomonas_euryale.AAC.36
MRRTLRRGAPRTSRRPCAFATTAVRPDGRTCALALRATQATGRTRTRGKRNVSDRRGYTCHKIGVVQWGGGDEAAAPVAWAARIASHASVRMNRRFVQERVLLRAISRPLLPLRLARPATPAHPTAVLVEAAIIFMKSGTSDFDALAENCALVVSSRSPQMRGGRSTML